LRYTIYIIIFDVGSLPWERQDTAERVRGGLTTSEPVVNPQEAARRRRAAALKAAEGLWKDRTDMPKDGVQAQEQLRVEWH
jgi:hypothetical protein